MEKSIGELDQYCKLHNKVLVQKKLNFCNGKKIQWIVDDSDEYRVR